MNRVYSSSTGEQIRNFKSDYRKPAMKRIKTRNVNIMLFKSGKIICNGSASKEQVEEALSRNFKSYAPIILKSETVIFNLGRCYHLHQLYYSTKPFSFYEPEIFPGAVTIKKFGKTFNVFSSGKVVMLGKGESSTPFNQFTDWLKNSGLFS